MLTRKSYQMMNPLKNNKNTQPIEIYKIKALARNSLQLHRT